MSSPRERLAFSLDETSVDPSARSSITPTQSLDSIVRGRALRHIASPQLPRIGEPAQSTANIPLSTEMIWPLTASDGGTQEHDRPDQLIRLVPTARGRAPIS
jgi:hypothetical protein